MGWRTGPNLSNRGVHTRQGFTLIELVIVMGTLMVLAGLLMPSLGSSVRTARQSASMVSLRECWSLVNVYADDHKEVYPIADKHIFRSAKFWYRAMIAADYVESEEQVDPRGMSRQREVTFALSMCLVYDWRRMVRGNTVPFEEAVCSPVRRSDILFPSRKGTMWQWYIYDTEFQTEWCCMPFRPPGAVVMGDDSVSLARSTDFILDQPEPPTMMGFPIQSTWSGCRGRDK